MSIVIQKNLLYPEILWNRPVHYYKNSAGKVLTIAGSRDRSSVALLSTEATFRSGTGIITLGFPEGLRIIYKGLLPEAISLPLPETPGYTLSKKAGSELIKQSEAVDLVVLGPGMSKNAETLALIWELLFKIKKPVVLDDDGIHSFTLGIKLLYENSGEEGLKTYISKRKENTILILGLSDILNILKVINFKPDNIKKITSKYIEKNIKKLSAYISSYLDMYLVVKNDKAFIVGPKGELIQDFFISDISRPGIISGIIGSFVAQNPEKPMEAIATAMYLYREAEILSKTRNDKVFASDIIKNLPEAIKQAEETL